MRIKGFASFTASRLPNGVSQGERSKLSHRFTGGYCSPDELEQRLVSLEALQRGPALVTAPWPRELGAEAFAMDVLEALA